MTLSDETKLSMASALAERLKRCTLELYAGHVLVATVGRPESVTVSQGRDVVLSGYAAAQARARGRVTRFLAVDGGVWVAEGTAGVTGEEADLHLSDVDLEPGDEVVADRLELGVD